MKVLVVGASGFIGRNLLLGVPRSWEVYGTCRNPVDFSRFLSAFGLDHVRPLQLDLRDEATVEKALASISRPDACVFLASDTAVRALVSDPPLDVTNNILTVANFLKSYRGGKILFMSSGAVYMGLDGPVSPTARLRPTIPYAISKHASELYVQFAAERGWAEGYVILRFFGAYGPFEPPRKITTKLVQSALARAREFTIFGDGRNLIDVMHIDDAVAGLVAVLQSDRINLTVDFCAGNAFDLNEFTERVAAIFGHQFTLHHEGESPEYIRFHASPHAMEEVFGFQPKIALPTGMRRFATWIQTQSRISA